jgi:hypothetical protein
MMSVAYTDDEARVDVGGAVGARNKMVGLQDEFAIAAMAFAKRNFTAFRIAE